GQAAEMAAVWYSERIQLGSCAFATRSLRQGCWAGDDLAKAGAWFASGGSNVPTSPGRWSRQNRLAHRVPTLSHRKHSSLQGSLAAAYRRQVGTYQRKR